MKISTKSMALALAVLSGAPAVTPAMAATAEERAKCEQMIKSMGAPPPHDHGKDKTGAPNAMTAEHLRCQQMMSGSGKSNQEHKSDHNHQK